MRTPHLSSSAGPLFASSPAMREVASRIRDLGTRRTPTLIVGEPGSGRRFVAGLIHAQQANGAASPYLALDCAGRGARELEEELFGTVSSGQWLVDDCRLEPVTAGGLLRRSCGGSLVILNVTEGAERTQARLARVLRDGEVADGENRSALHVDIRTITCVDPTFDAAVEEGRVRADLHRSLSRARIDVPPLRHRREDIPALVEHLVSTICPGANGPAKTVAAPALTLLAALPYRENAHELSQLLETLVRRVRGSVVHLDDVLAVVRLDGPTARTPVDGTLRAARARFEREYILAVLRQQRGRVTDAARVLGLQRTNLYRKMRNLRVTLDGNSTCKADCDA
jgi:DNA-binding NtrC family response regulator